jgi:hypothetical protein
MTDDGLQTLCETSSFDVKLRASYKSVRPLSSDGAIAQLGERLLCKQEVVGSIPSGSTRRFDLAARPVMF